MPLIAFPGGLVPRRRLAAGSLPWSQGMWHSEAIGAAIKAHSLSARGPDMKTDGEKEFPWQA
ncbi:hypothetical protein WCLP8_5220016 [uncultured Gammaproteobacteria bacterium]